MIGSAVSLRRVIEVWIISTVVYYSVYFGAADDVLEQPLEQWQEILALALPALVLAVCLGFSMLHLFLLASFVAFIPAVGSLWVVQEFVMKELFKSQQELLEEADYYSSEYDDY